MRWGVAGYGDVIVRRVLPALQDLGQEVVYVWGRDADRAAAVARRHRIPRGGADLGHLLADVDAVYVGTPVASHVALGVRAAQAGRHILIEKPLAGNLQPGGGCIAALADAAGVCAGVAYYRRLAPVAGWLREKLAGERRYRVRLEFRRDFAPRPDHPMFWRTDSAVAGGGVLADVGSHRLDLLLLVLGPPSEVVARLSRRFPRGTERRADVMLRWPSGTEADCSLEWRPGPARDSLALLAWGKASTLDPLDTGLSVNPHAALIADFVTAAAESRPPVCPVTEAVLVDEVIAAAERSSRLDGRAVSPRLAPARSR